MKGLGRLCAGGWVVTALLCGASLGAQTGSSAADEALVAGSQALRAGEFGQAVASFQQVTALRPGFAEGFLNLGIAEQQSGDSVAAIAALRKARSLKPGLRGVNLMLGIAEYQGNHAAEAEVDLAAEAKLNPKDAKALMWLGMAQMAQDHAEAAAKSLDAAAALAPEDPDVLFHRGRAHLLVSKSSYSKMFALAPDSFRVHVVLGQADAEADRNEDAIGEYKLAVERAPRQPGLHEELADLYWATGKTDLADGMYQEELRLDPSSVTSAYKLGSLRVILGQAAAAMEPLRQAIALDGSFESAYYYLGRAQLETGETDAGIANLKRASTAAGDTTLNSLAFYQLSRAWRRAHRMAEADAALAEFRRLRDAIDADQKARRAAKTGRRGELPRPEVVPAEGAESPT